MSFPRDRAFRNLPVALVLRRSHGSGKPPTVYEWLGCRKAIAAGIRSCSLKPSAVSGPGALRMSCRRTAAARATSFAHRRLWKKSANSRRPFLKPPSVIVTGSGTWPIRRYRLAIEPTDKEMLILLSVCGASFSRNDPRSGYTSAAKPQIGQDGRRGSVNIHPF
jgi:hypothetical protein